MTKKIRLHIACFFRCQCPLGRAGPNCGIRIRVSQPKFNGATSFIGLPRPKNILRALSVSFKFKPVSLKDSVVMYCGQSPEGQGDFASVTIKDKHVEFRYDTGTGKISHSTTLQFQLQDNRFCFWNTSFIRPCAFTKKFKKVQTIFLFSLF